MLNTINNQPIINPNQTIQVIDRVVEPNRVPIVGQSEKQQQTADYGYSANQNSLANGVYKNTLKTKNTTNNASNTSNGVKSNQSNALVSEDTNINSGNNSNNSNSTNTSNNFFQLQNETEFDKQIDKVNEQLNGKNLNLSYFQDKETGQLVVQIRDTQTNDLIKQIPPKEVLAVADSIDQFLESYDKNGIQNKPIITLPILNESA